MPTFKLTLTTKTTTGKVVKRTTLTTTTGKITTDIPNTGRKVDITIYTDGGGTVTLTDIDVDQLTGPGGYWVTIPTGGTPGQTVMQPLMPGTPSLEFFGTCDGGRLGITERPNLTGVVSFQSDRTGTGCGPGVALIFDGMFFNGVLSPSASFTYFGQDIRHTFPTGSFIGEQIVSLITLGGQVGLVSWQGGAAQIYGTGGFALANKILTINFGGPASTQNSWVPGGALGIGFSYAPPGLQIANRQIKLFAQYEHVWLADATFTSPAASPAFNYTFANGLDLVSVGISIALSPGQSGRRALINLGQ